MVDCFCEYAWSTLLLNLVDITRKLSRPLPTITNPLSLHPSKSPKLPCPPPLSPSLAHPTHHPTPPTFLEKIRPMAPTGARRMRQGTLIPLTILLLFVIVTRGVSKDFQPLCLSRTNRPAPTTWQRSLLSLRLRGGMGRPKKDDSDDDDDGDDDDDESGDNDDDDDDDEGGMSSSASSDDKKKGKGKKNAKKSNPKSEEDDDDDEVDMQESGSGEGSGISGSDDEGNRWANSLLRADGIQASMGINKAKSNKSNKRFDDQDDDGSRSDGRQRDRGPMKCFRCNQEGHISRDCPDSSGRDDRKCYQNMLRSFVRRALREEEEEAVVEEETGSASAAVKKGIYLVIAVSQVMILVDAVVSVDEEVDEVEGAAEAAEAAEVEGEVAEADFVVTTTRQDWLLRLTFSGTLLSEQSSLGCFGINYESIIRPCRKVLFASDR
eukprot:764141-Hanusia_phi.AAC.1